MDLLTVERYDFKSDWTIGRLLLNGVKDGFILEDTFRPDGTKIHGRTAIPFGRFLLDVRQSPKFSKEYLWSDSKKILIRPAEQSNFPTINDLRPHDLLWLSNVPNFQFILIHWGNTSVDTDGCLLVGDSLGIVNNQEAVINSRKYYKSLYPKIYPLIKAGNQHINIVRV
jgi:hypothetical protein